ncbi:hypothetical protein MSIMFI_02019 [Mycobacterium simulans]|nr:hypothetical protein MSIMFI_02019 [Mycobacterium simulans]
MPTSAGATRLTGSGVGPCSRVQGLHKLLVKHRRPCAEHLIGLCMRGKQRRHHGRHNRSDTEKGRYAETAENSYVSMSPTVHCVPAPA